jgi:preprotein translocase subunit SecA
MFDAMTAAIREDAVRLMMRARFSAENASRRQAVAKNMAEAHSSSNSFGGSSEHSKPIQKSATAPRPSAPRPSAPAQMPARRDMAKVGRNDPCPCGSGKKYKNCHGQNEK